MLFIINVFAVKQNLNFIFQTVNLLTNYSKKKQYVKKILRYKQSLLEYFGNCNMDTFLPDNSFIYVLQTK